MNRFPFTVSDSFIGVRFVILSFYMIISAMIAIPLSAQEDFKGTVTAKGQVLILSGKVLDKRGRPVPNASVEIWQTDGQGIYHHPGDSNTNQRDRDFQFFGTSVCNSSGQYIFRTIIPGEYEPRPRHIHVKIRQSGQVLLTTQIYFAVDGEIAGIGGRAQNLRMEIDPDDSMGYTGKFDFIVDTGLEGDLRLTEKQTEGPYYPLEDVSLYDNDLAQVPPIY